jgi:hypothetical protein
MQGVPAIGQSSTAKISMIFTPIYDDGRIFLNASPSQQSSIFQVGYNQDRIVM